MSLIPLHAVVLLYRKKQSTLYCRESLGLNAFIKEKKLSNLFCKADFNFLIMKSYLHTIYYFSGKLILINLAFNK